MKNQCSQLFRHFALPLALAGATLCFTGCSSTKNQADKKEIHHRGWIGGELAHMGGLPKSFAVSNHTGLLITALATNTPAHAAGLRAGDLILELDHQPVTRLKDFHRIVDGREPGSPLTLTAWREGQSAEYTVPVGREEYRQWGYLGFGVFLGGLDLWPNPGFSLFVLGYHPGSPHRDELNSVENSFRRNHYSADYHPRDEDWNAWLVVFGVGRQKEILLQEPVALRAASKPSNAVVSP